MSKKKHHHTIKKLRTRLKKAEASKAKWKTKAKRLEAKLKKAGAKVAKRSKQDEPTPLATPELPDESWTVTRLRVSAREAGVAGYSRMSKSALLDTLKQPSAV